MNFIQFPYAVLRSHKMHLSFLQNCTVVARPDLIYHRTMGKCKRKIVKFSAFFLTELFRHFLFMLFVCFPPLSDAVRNRIMEDFDVFAVVHPFAYHRI